MFGGAGNDTLIGDSSYAVNISGNDYLDGEDGHDLLFGDGGSDTLYGGDGNDQLVGDGEDVPTAFHGNDLLDGGKGSDTLWGGSGVDTLFGGEGVDFLLGGEGNDSLDGGDDNDQLQGEAGNDLLSGGTGADTLLGGLGNDTLLGGAGIDYLQGDAGDDVYILNAGEADNSGPLYEAVDDRVGSNTIRFGAGISASSFVMIEGTETDALVFDYTSTDGVYIKGGLVGAVENFEFAGGTTIGWRQLISQYYNRRVNYSTAASGAKLAGGSQGDSITALGGGSEISGGLGNDYLYGRGGSNTYLYDIGDGTDIINDIGGQVDTLGAPAPNRIKFGAGITQADIHHELKLGSLLIRVGTDPSDTIEIKNFNRDDAYGTRSIDLFEFDDGTMLTYEQLLAKGFDFTGTDRADVISGTSVTDRMQGGLGADQLLGGQGDDMLDGGDGNDLLVGGDGADTMLGGAGDDRFKVDNVGDVVVELDAGGVDVVESVIDYTLTANVENLLLLGSDALSGTGNGLDNFLAGNDGGNTLSGGMGNDILDGGAGDDTLDGGDGNDDLDGGAGNDLLIGGVGNDTYHLNEGGGQDWVTEVAGETSTIAFSVLRFSDLSGKREGNNLVLGSIASDDTLTLEDFYLAPETWVVQDNFGLARSLATVLAENETRRAGEGLVGGLKEAFVASRRTGQINELLAMGYQQAGESNFKLFPGLHLSYYHTEVTAYLAGYTSSSSTSASAYVTSDYVQTELKTINVSSNDANIKPTTGPEYWYTYVVTSQQDLQVNWDGLYVGRTTSNSYTPAQYENAIVWDSPTHWHYELVLISGGQLISTTVTEAVSGDANILAITDPSGAGVVPNGYTLGPAALAGAVLPTLFEAEITEYRDTRLNMDVQAGDANNFIDSSRFPRGLVQAGAGDDTVVTDDEWGYGGQLGSGDPGYTDTYDRSGTGGFIDAGDGNDSVATGNYADLLYGGEGSDFLAGGGGSDRYIFLSQDAGVDLVFDQGWSGGESGAVDVVEFESGIRPQDLRFDYGQYYFQRPYTTLNVYWGNDRGVTVVMPRSDSNRIGEGVELFKFADGTTLSMADMLVLAGPAPSFDPPSDYQGFYKIDGHAAKVVVNASSTPLTGEGPFDVLVGGAGDDEIHVGAGKNVVLAGGAYGTVDTVYLMPGSATLTIDFHLSGDVRFVGQGQLTLTSVSDEAGGNVYLTREGNDLRIDHALLVDWFISADRPKVALQVYDPLAFYSDAGQQLQNGPRYDVNVLSDLFMAYFGGTAEGMSVSLQNLSVESALLGSATPDFGEQFAKDQIRHYMRWSGNGGLLGYLGVPQRPLNFSIGQGAQSTASLLPFDFIAFDPAITTLDIQVTKDGNDLVLAHRNGADSLRLTDWYLNPTGMEVYFSDGQVWDAATLSALVATDAITGTSGDDLLTGTDLADTLIGGTGSDTLVGGAGADTYVFGLGDGVDTISDIAALGEDNSIVFGAGITPESITLGLGSLVVRYGDQGDAIHLTNFDPQNVYGPRTIETFRFADGTVLSYEQLLARGFDFNGTSLDDYFEGTNVADRMQGGAGDDLLSGGEGGDALDGGSGNETLHGGSGNDLLQGGTGTDYMLGGLGSDTYAYNVGDGPDSILELESDLADIDRVVFGAGITLADLTVLRTGSTGYDLQIQTGAAGDTLDLKGWFNSDVSGRVEAFHFSDGSVATAAQIEELINYAPQADYPIANYSLSEDQAFNIAVESSTFSDPDGDVLVYTATLADGTVLPSWLSFDASVRTFSGTPGNEHIGAYSVRVIATDPLGLSASQDFTLSVANVNDAPILATLVADQIANEGSAFSYTLPANSFSDIDAGDVLSYDTTLADGSPLPAWLNFDTATLTFSGAPANDNIGTLSVKVTATDMAGTSVSDVFDLTVVNVNDAPTVSVPLVDQTASEGVAFSFATPNTTFIDIDSGDTLIYSAQLADGSALPSWLTFNASTRTFAGTPTNTAAGAYTVRITATDQAGASAFDEFVLNVADTLATTLTGTSSADTLNGTNGKDTISSLGGNDVLNGNAGDDTLDGGTGSDKLFGGTGNDTYVVDNTGDVVTENANEGLDSVNSIVTHTLATNVENLTLTGASAINGTGNTLDNVLIGNSAINTLTGGAGNDTLDGGAGADKLLGGTGNDSYVVDNASDVVTENVNEGTDAVQAYLSYTLAANVENLTLLGSSAINATGNTLSNILTGNSANNTLNGGTGADTMQGGSGNDTYVVDNVGDVVSENANEGTDTVQSGITTTLVANVENLTLTGSSAINGNGNDLNNALTGNSGVNSLYGYAGDDTLNGGTGADKLYGGIGNDTYVVDNTGDVVTENANEGTDTVQSSVTYTLGNNVENLTLTGTSGNKATGNSLDNILIGNSGANTLTGNAGNDTLVGGAGADTMVGGTGDDTYVVDNASDKVTESSNQGTDTVNSNRTYTLAANVEALVLTGMSAINGTDNTLNSLLIGNSGVNTLTAGTGNDILHGGGGSDILKDTSGNNLLAGGAGNDTLTGAAGRELFIGGTGNDTITTGTGYDIIAFNRGDGVDTVRLSSSQDNTISLGGGIRNTDLAFRKSSNDLILDTGNSESIVLQGWYASTSNKSVLTLQMIEEASIDFAPGGGNTLTDNKVEQFNFAGLVTQFDQARSANPALTSWALSNALLTFYLGGSDTAAIGGDLAYQYGKTGGLSNIGFSAAQSMLGNAQFGQVSQAINQPGLADGLVKLSA